ncbi:MAG: DUF2007 domain-containing protein [Phycisphaerae bacterium]|nr:DUF2007 domain-containing protein [Phycisphaerae bacterium]
MASTREYVRVLMAGSVEEAEFLKTLLNSNDIPAILEGGHSEVGGMPMSVLDGGVPVLVPDDMKADAEAILAEQHIAPEDEEEFEREAEETPPEEPNDLE